MDTRFEALRVDIRYLVCVKKPQSGRTVKRSEYEHLVEELQTRMATDEAKALYKLRKQTVELGFADLKVHRELRRFSGKGLSRARTEVGLLVLAHNGLTVVRTLETPRKTVAYKRDDLYRIDGEGNV